MEGTDLDCRVPSRMLISFQVAITLNSSILYLPPPKIVDHCELDKPHINIYNDKANHTVI